MIRLEYRDWQILIFQQDSQWSYIFCPHDGEPLQCYNSHQNYDIACAEAKTLIDRLITRCAIAEIMDDWLDAGQITSHQYSKLDRLIQDLAKNSVWTHLVSAEKQPQPPPETPPDAWPEYPE